MSNLDYIRYMFEEQYRERSNDFECLKEEVIQGRTRCICIPGIAVNYIANEMKFLKKQKSQKEWKFAWNEEHCIYVVEKDANDWNFEIPDFVLDEVAIIEPEEYSFCKEHITKYTYLLPTGNMVQDDLDFWILWPVHERTELKVFMLLARDYRGVYDIPVYADKLFRLTLFLHPLSGLKVIENNLKNREKDTWFINYNLNLLEQYLGMNHQLCDCKNNMEKNSLPKMLEIIKEFVGFDLLLLYHYFQTSDDVEGIEVWSDLLKQKINDLLKMRSTAPQSRVQKLYKKLLKCKK